jgi:hypothetical protein
MILVIVLATASCASISDDLIPDSTSFSPGGQRFEGTVNVQTLVIMGYAPLRRPEHWFKRLLLKEAVEKAIAKNNLFTRIEQGTADYILDIWLDECELTIPPMGIGEYRAKMASIWRLTRVSDGKVLVDEYIGTQGTFNKPGFGPGQKSMVDALQKMIQNGLAALSGKSNTHLSAESIAGLRPSIAPWMNNVRLNWSKLRIGMTLDEVEKTIGTVRTSGAILGYVAIKMKSNLKINDVKIAQDPSSLAVIARLKKTDDNFVYVKREVDLNSVMVTHVEGGFPFQLTSSNYGTKIPWDWIDIRKSNDPVFISQDYQCISGIYLLEFIDDKLARYHQYY